MSHVPARSGHVVVSGANAAKSRRPENEAEILYTQAPTFTAMSLLRKENETIVSRYATAFDTANLATFEEVFDLDVVGHNPSPRQAPGLEASSRRFA